MALNRQKVSIPFALGLDTKTDVKQENIGRLKRLKNVIFDTIKKLRKRNGYNLTLTKTLDGSQISNAKTLTSFKSELGLFTKTDFYSLSEATGKWTAKGKTFNGFPTSVPVVRDDYSKSNYNLASAENLNAHVYQDSQGIHVTIKDNISGNFLLPDTLISATGIKPIVNSIQNTLFIFFIDSTDLKYRRINLISPTTVEPEVTVVSDLHASDPIYDAIEAGNKNIIAYRNNTPELNLLSVDVTGAVSSITTLAGEDPSTCIEIFEDSLSRIVLSYGSSTEVKVTIRSLTLSGNILAPTLVDTVTDLKNVTLIQRPESSDYLICYELGASSDKDHLIKLNTITLAGSVGTPSTLMRSVGLASRLFTTDNKYYVNAIHKSTLQSSYFIVETDGFLASKISPSIGGDFVTSGSLPKVIDQGDSKFLLASQVKTRTITDDGTFFSVLGINETTIDFDINDPYQNDQLGDNLMISGGLLRMYDGNVAVEHGFQIYPEDLAAGSNATTGGSLSDGEYLYSAVYAWTDNFGQVHRSSPSIPFSITLSGGTATQTQDVEVPTLRITDKENVIIELYRTESGGEVFYKVTSTTAPTFNDKTSNTVTITDTISDSDLIDNEILYTEGGILENIAAPACKIVESFDDRIFLAGLEDTNKIMFSKIRDEYEPVEFNDTFYKYVNDIGGSITAMQVLDDKLIIFKQDAIFYISGDGPNDLGEQDTFIEPERVSSEVGAIDGKSVVLTPQGIFFKSRKGIYILTRGLSLEYIGAAVEDFNDLTITSAVVVPDDNQVRFTTLDGDCLVYNYYVGQWATFDNHRALSSIVLENDYYYLRSDGVLYKENNETFSDNGSAVNIALESGWISFAQVQGFQRVYRLFLLSEYFSKHKLRIRIAYNFNESFTQEKIIDTADFITDARYGADSPYGSGTPYGTNGNVHQIRLDLKKQKCQSIKIRIEEIQDEEIGEGLSLSNVMFEVGVKKAGFKPDQSVVYGSDDA